jgi:hypothetical protein
MEKTMNNFQTAWKQFAAQRSLTSSDMAVLCLSKAARKEDPQEALEQAKYYLKKSFNPITKPVKLANGAYPYWALWNALWDIEKSQVFKAYSEFWTKEAREQVAAMAKKLIAGFGRVNL